MRIAVTANGSDPGSLVDARFHAAAYLLVYDSEGERWGSYVLRPGKRPRDHGREKVRQVVQTGAACLISAGIDPVSFRQLGQSGVTVFSAPAATAKEAALLCLGGALTTMCAPDAVDVALLARRPAARKS